MTQLHIRNGRLDPTRSKLFALVGYEPEERYPSFYLSFRSDDKKQALELAAEEIARTYEHYGPQIRLLLLPVPPRFS